MTTPPYLLAYIRRGDVTTGSRVEAVHLAAATGTVPPGKLGSVVDVDLTAGRIAVRWDNGVDAPIVLDTDDWWWVCSSCDKNDLTEDMCPNTAGDKGTQWCNDCCGED